MATNNPSTFHISKRRRDVWDVELKLANKLIDVCKKHDLKIFADSGTLLGAIRHKGFIPWDDDMDFVMLRADYDKLIEVAGSEFEAPFFFQTIDTDDGYFRPHAQLRMDNTTSILDSEIGAFGFHQGIFIDVFPLDYISKNERENIRVCKRLIFLDKLIHAKADTRRRRSVAKNLIAKALRPFCPSIRSLYDKYDRTIAETRDRSNLVDKVTYYKNLKRYKRFPERYFKKQLYVSFMNTKIPVSQEYDAMLKRYYGDNYMTPTSAPPGHGSVIASAEEDYKSVISKYKNGELKDEDYRL